MMFSGNTCNQVPGDYDAVPEDLIYSGQVKLLTP
jgi:hypothetical protein